MEKSPQKKYPIASRVIFNLRRQGFSPDRVSTAIKVFGSVIAYECGIDPVRLLAKAERADPEESVESLVEQAPACAGGKAMNPTQMIFALMIGSWSVVALVIWGVWTLIR